MNKTKKKKTSKTPYLLLIPWLCFFTMFLFVPLLMGIFYSFYDYNFVSLEFTGIENYKYILNDDIFIKSIINTIKMAFIIVTFTIVLSLLISYIIVKQNKKIQTLSKMSLYIPAVSSSAAVVAVWRWIFNPAMGISSSLCMKFGITAIDWFGQPLNATTIVCFLVLVFSLGQPVIIYTSAMTSIPKSYYESATLDGASSIKQFFSITLPLIVPTTVYILITSTIALLQIFEVPMLLTAGGPQYSTTTILLLLYKTAFEYGKFGRAAAMGVVLFIIIAIVTLLQYKIVKKDKYEY